MPTNRLLIITLISGLLLFAAAREAEAVFTIEFNLHSIDFDSMDSGASGSFKDDVPSQGLTITCTTDEGNAWQLKVRNEQPLTHISNPGATIPDTSFRWYVESTTGNTGQLGYSLNQREDFTIEKTIYTGTAGEGAAGIDFTTKYELTVPPNIQSGDYSSTVVFTFTE